VVVRPHRCTGWLEQQTMGVLRDRLLDELEEADVHGRLGLFTPVLDGDDEHRLTVHAKVMIVDDRFVRIGSSNLTRRSFAMDSECDLAIEADSVDEPVTRSIRRLCNRLLAEHLGSDEDEVDRTRTETGSLLAAIEELGAGPRFLEPLRISGEAPTATASIAATIGDPGDPIDAETVMEDFRDKVVGGFGRFSGVFGILGIAAFALALAMAWRYTPLAEYVQVDAVLDWIDGLRSSRAAPVGLLVVYLALGLAAFPITVVNVATAIAFGPWAWFLYALSGSLASAVLTFAVGRRFGSRVIHRISSGLVYRASRAIGKRGFLAVLSCRLVPVAPFTVINVVAGAMPIRIRDYLLGTLVGMAPGIAVLAAFGDRILKVVDDPNPMNAILLAAVVAVWLGLGWGFSRLLGASVENR
jgi:phospholipase D1/2